MVLANPDHASRKPTQEIDSSPLLSTSLGLDRTVYIYIYTLYMTVYLVISLLKTPYIYVVLAYPTHLTTSIGVSKNRTGTNSTSTKMWQPFRKHYV
jgi:hypothetical protein